jgi:hypothetical protein
MLAEIGAADAAPDGAGRPGPLDPASRRGGRVPARVRGGRRGATTIIPGLVDGHSHLTLPGGSHWIERGADPTETLVAVAESNGELQHRSGVR